MDIGWEIEGERQVNWVPFLMIRIAAAEADKEGSSSAAATRSISSHCRSSCHEECLKSKRSGGV
jgi:hypothetical protein